MFRSKTDISSELIIEKSIRMRKHVLDKMINKREKRAVRREVDESKAKEVAAGGQRELGEEDDRG